MSRVLLLMQSMAGIGGTERMVAALAGLLGQDHEVHVAAFDPPGTTPAVKLGAPFHALGAGHDLPLPLRWITYAAQARALARLKRRLGVDITISNLWRADLISILSGGGDRKIALAHINVVGNPTNAAMLRARPLVAALYRRCDRVVAVSAALARELTALYRLAPDRVAAIDNFVALPAGIVPQRRGAGTRLIWCGRFVPEKNTAALVDIVVALRASDPTLQLMMVGDGPELDAVRRRAVAAGLTIGDDADSDAALVFTGRLADPYPAIAGADAMLLPSLHEGLPMVLLEALALSVPVIAADCPSGGVHGALGGTTPHDPARDRPETTSCGMLLPVPPSPLWAERIAALLADRAALQALSRGAAQRAQDFTPDAARAKWQALLA